MASVEIQLLNEFKNPHLDITERKEKLKELSKTDRGIAALLSDMILQIEFSRECSDESEHISVEDMLELSLVPDWSHIVGFQRHIEVCQTCREQYFNVCDTYEQWPLLTESRETRAPLAADTGKKGLQKDIDLVDLVDNFQSRYQIQHIYYTHVSGRFECILPDSFTDRATFIFMDDQKNPILLSNDKGDTTYTWTIEPFEKAQEGVPILNQGKRYAWLYDRDSNRPVCSMTAIRY